MGSSPDKEMFPPFALIAELIYPVAPDSSVGVRTSGPRLPSLTEDQ